MFVPVSYSNLLDMSQTPVVVELRQDGKIEAIHIHGHRVASLNIFSALSRIAMFCKQEVQQIVYKWGSSDAAPYLSDKQFLQTAALIASLFVQKYEPTAS